MGMLNGLDVTVSERMYCAISFDGIVRGLARTPDGARLDAAADAEVADADALRVVKISASVAQHVLRGMRNADDLGIV